VDQPPTRLLLSRPAGAAATIRLDSPVVPILRRLGRKALRQSAYARYVLGRGSGSAAPGSPEAIFAFADVNLGISQLPDEVLRFHAFLRERSPRVVCEIGTALGGHLYMLSRSLPTVTTLIGVDLQVRNRTFLRRLLSDKRDVHLIDGDSRSTSVRKAVERAVGGLGVDVLFIDGDHRYDGVRSDYLNYRGLVRDGGIIAFHDIVDDYSTRFGNETGNWTGDVPVFWRGLKPHVPTLEFVATPEQDGFGIGVLIHSAAAPTPPELGD
jgi:predicted O-methyltransferase YrrM